MDHVHTNDTGSTPPHLCGTGREVRGVPGLWLDNFAEGRFYALYNGRRIGHIIGGNRNYALEVGPETKGHFKTPALAAKAAIEYVDA